MTPNLLILGGTTEATALARAVAEAGIAGTVSFAGRVARPVRQPLPQRVGGFGGVAGLKDYLTTERITHVVDATHPFAAQMSRNAIAACAQAEVPLLALTRPPWVAQEGDTWTHVPNIAGAVAALDRPACRVMLAVGRMHLAEFAPNPQHFYLLRLVDPPKSALPLPQTEVLISRGPFTQADDEALILAHGIELVVSKNAGGTGAYAKIAAARSLGLPVIMIDRPAIPDRPQVAAPAEVLDWLRHASTDLGV
ncbi:cobalt-precorrin-6A reductase [Rhodobacteraceae bacterium N5(2021)]|uniref:Cobalt-precorrin-6A reductase n=1 Tax=Gymnodinialimonas phycosphaerae TaxID=2841589 RepID=A0A975YHK4_9RHOB|nr:cobalt-precorrin-6A reductase [Gymnodinialimonas phycosphaerae]MBY4892769.1 cobalt-precorrin-6A reductase [Gymnodinialimonas phycosphaerae]